LYGQYWVNPLNKFLILAAFIVILSALLIAYDRPAKKKQKITGRGGDFES
jgi:hypothetical protein